MSNVEMSREQLEAYESFKQDPARLLGNVFVKRHNDAFTAFWESWDERDLAIRRQSDAS